MALTVARATRLTAKLAAPPLRSISDPTPTTTPPARSTHSTTSRVEPPVVMTSSTTRHRSPACSAKPRRSDITPLSRSVKSARTPSARATSWATRMPPMAGAGLDGRSGRGRAHLIVAARSGDDRLTGGTRFLMGGPVSASPHTPLFAGRANSWRPPSRSNPGRHDHEFLPELEPQRADLARRGHAAVEPRGFRQSGQTEYMALDRRHDAELGVEGVAIEARQHRHAETDGTGYREVLGRSGRGF